MPWFQRDWDLWTCCYLLWTCETLMPWFQRDWDLGGLLLYCLLLWNTNALISKGLRHALVNWSSVTLKGLRLPCLLGSLISNETLMPWFQRDWDIAEGNSLPCLLETLMPWFQRDWDSCWLLRLKLLMIETLMPWFQRDWDQDSSTFTAAEFWNTNALISKGLRPRLTQNSAGVNVETLMPWFQRDWDQDWPRIQLVWTWKH